MEGKKLLDVLCVKLISGPVGGNLFIYNVPPHYTDQDLASAFAQFGNLLSAKVFIDKATGMSKGFGE